LAALHATINGEDPVLLVLAADHLIKDNQAFRNAITKAEKLADQGELISFGIVPDQPHTGYGYIKAGEQAGDGFEVAQFVEKPALETAKEYVDSGCYYWNSGMCMFKASRYLEELAKYNPEMLDVCKRAIDTERPDLDFIRVDHDIFVTCPDDSIDSGARFQVKRITVKPGEKLSVQMHHHRAKHWIVVSGSANVTSNEETQLVTENESVGAVHALENPGKIPLELIEVQSGAYLGEGDIVRFSDRYGRVAK